MGVTVKSSVNIGLKTGYSVLVTVAAGFVGIHISAALRWRGDYVLGLDNFNSYYDPTLKRACLTCVEKKWDFHCGRGHKRHRFAERTL
uniref:Putative NAD(P)-binding domain-containing protein n=1 Tax=Helianthus annuus TaxID=4232 RepID=A0A251SX57_HELAN